MDILNELLIDNKLIYLVSMLIVVDIITGIALAMQSHTIKSAVFRNGGYKKFLIILLCVTCWTVDKLYFSGDILYTVACSYYIINELISITENLGNMGLPVPQKVKRILANLKN